MKLSQALPTIIGLSLTGLGAVFLYLIMKKDEEEWVMRYTKTKTSHNIVITVQIPKECVGAVIGRGGANIKDIQQRTRAKINFKDELETETHRVCSIEGTPESAQLAESLIREFIMNQPLIEIVDILVPQYCCGRIIGRNGDTIRNISRQSGAKISIQSGDITSNKYDDRKISIKGSADQIESAKVLINQKVEEEKEMRQKIQSTLANRSPRNTGKNNFLTSGEEQKKAKESHEERLTFASRDGYMEVYVSAMEDPGRFWVQVVGTRAVELDQLVEKMTDYYSQDANKNLHVLKNINVNDIVAAPFANDGKWYRAKVTEVNLDDYDPEESQVTLYYVDYGDSSILPKKYIFEIRTDFLRLRYQAIECSLANVKPSGDAWSDEASDMFENLSHLAQWRPVITRIQSYEDRKRGNREGSPIPHVMLYDTTGSQCYKDDSDERSPVFVELYDTDGPQDINIAEELVNNGYAVWQEGKSGSRPPRKSVRSSINGASSSGRSTPPQSVTSSGAEAGSSTVDQNNVEESPNTKPKSFTETGNGKVDVGHDSKHKPYTELGDARVNVVLPQKRYSGGGKTVPERKAEEDNDNDMEMF